MADEPAPLSARWAGGSLGFMLRTWRRRRRVNQAELAERVGVSAKHLSFLETGRAQPSREMIDWIAQALELSEDERVRLAEAAGFVGGYVPFGSMAETSERALDDLRATLEAFPVPAIAHDRLGTVLAHNEVFASFARPYFDVGNLVGTSSGHVILRGFGRHIDNLPEVVWFYVRRLEAEILRGREVEPELVALRDELSAVCASPPSMRVGPFPYWVPLTIRTHEGQRRHMRLTTMTLGAPHDVAWRDSRLALLLDAPAAG